MVLLAHALLLAAVAAVPPKEKEKPIKAVGTFGKVPKVDGDLKDFTGATAFKLPAAAEKQLEVSAGFKGDTVYVAATFKGEPEVAAAAELEVMIDFPGAGTTARGHVWRFGPEGLRKADPAVAAPDWANALLAVASKQDKKGLHYELAIPARALPRFQGNLQLSFNLCVIRHDGEARVDSCAGGGMPGGPLKLPDDLRKNLKLNPPNDVQGIEARPTGWVGYAELHYPTWVLSDSLLTPEALGAVIAGEGAIDAEKLSLPIPQKLVLPDNRPVFTVLTGRNPYSEDKCNDSYELRMALYVVKGSTANRALEWPAVRCSLGRASHVELAPDGTLTIDYSNGTKATFTWNGSLFRRSEYGSR